MPPSPHPQDLPTPRGLGLNAGLRTRLITTAGALFASHGLPNVTLELIASEARVSEETVRSHFPSVGSALAASLSFVNTGLLDSSRQEASPRSWAAFEALIAAMVHGSATPGFDRLYHDAQMAASADDHPAHDWLVDQQGQMRAAIAEALRTGLEDGDMRPDASVDEIHRLVAATLVGVHPMELALPPQPCTTNTLEVLLGCLKARYATPEYLARG
ncbi:TetR/AcrR family transcriptional regulator [Galactobacter valiniphilus]|uniref:TetR/AcrR family transcriptional regulator n=1 Tax=Galactobacter valiniphilus TaxID=2676122 RepID=UPI00373671BE